MPSRTNEGRFHANEAAVIWVLWLTYGSFYFCRTNISAAVPGLEAELALSKGEIGLILGSLKIAYGLGQFINGQLAERISPRKLLALGMLASTLLNVIFGFGTAVYFLTFVWACNGYFQALGWTPCMRVAANWFDVSHRGRAIGIIGTGYQLTAALTFVVAGAAVHWFGWRGALLLPAALLALSCAHMLLFLRERPEEESRTTEAPGAAAAIPNPGPTTRPRSVAENVLLTLSNPWLWLLGLSLGLLNACRYGFLDWGVAHLVETRGSSVARAAINYALLPIGGILGSLVTGWATDRFFGGRRAPVICGLLVALGVFTLSYSRVVQSSLVLSLALLLLIGFAVFGPQVLLVGTAPIDLAKQGTAAAAVGFVNFMGYMGAFSGAQVTGLIVDRYQWDAALLFWAACAFGAAAAAALLWKAKTNHA
jgi:MFS transporter, OPA family, glycerol-3-phosphate transporter